MSDSERRRWTDVEAELSRERRLAALSRRLGVTPSPWLILCWAIAATLGLALVLPGIVVHSVSMLTAGAVILATTCELSGVALIATGLRDMWRQR